MTEVAIASVLIRPDTTGFRATLQAEVLAASKGVVVPISVVATGTGAAAVTKETKALEAALVSQGGVLLGNAEATTVDAVAKKRLAVSTIESAAALKVEKDIALQEGLAQRKAAADALASARAHEQLARGAGATSLSLLGIRGATLAASAPFLAGAAAITIFVKSIKVASSEEEALARVTKILGDTLGKQLESRAFGLAEGFGLSAEQALKAEGAFAQLLVVTGFTQTESAKLSERLVKLAVDFSALNDIPVDQTFKSFQLGITGNLRGMRQYVGQIRNVEIEQVALNQTGKATAKELTTQELAQARLTLIFRRGVIALNAYKERSHDLAGESRILSANLSNLATRIGQLVIPGFTELEHRANRLFAILGKIGSLKINIPGPDKKDSSLWDDLREAAFRASAGLVGSAKSMGQAGGAASSLGANIGALSQQFNLLAAAAAAARAAVLASLAGVSGQIAGLQEKVLDVRIAGGSIDQQIAAQQAIADKAAAGARKAGTKHVKQRRDFKRTQDSALAEIASLQAQQAAAAKKGAGAAVSAAKDLQQILDDADRAFLDAFGLREGAHQLRDVIVQRTNNLKDDIREGIAWRKVLQAQIALTKKTIHDVLLRAQTVLDLKIAVAIENAALDDLRRQRDDRIKARKQTIEQRRKDRIASLEESLQLNIDFAQMNKNVPAEIRAHQALLRELRRRKKHATEGTVEYRELRNRIREQELAIKELRKQTADRGKAFRALSFEFLQQQQGFAANLLSNLLPAGVLAGTVGGGTAKGFGGLPITDFTGGREDPTRGLGKAAQISEARDKGVTQGQMGVLIELTRQMVRILSGQKAGSQHPEAGRQRATGAAAMDILVM